MNWLESLLWDPSSVAHIVCLYAFVISVGVLLGKIKIFGVSLGVTFVLFTGILMGHFGFTGETHILHFIREFGLILFVFCIGLQVGPSFFSSFKKGGMTLNMLAVGIVALNIVVALSIYFIDGNIDLPMIVGILYGAVTNTPGLGAAQEALNQLNYTGDPYRTGICLRLSAWCSRHHRFYHCRTLYLPHQPEKGRRRAQYAGSGYETHAAYAAPRGT